MEAATAAATAAAQTPLPQSPPKSLDPGWPPAGVDASAWIPGRDAGSASASPKRPQVRLNQQELEALLQSVVAHLKSQGARLDRLEQEAKLVNDSLGTVALHHRNSVAEADARMRDHVAAASNDMAGAMGAIDAALKATIEAAHARLTESQRDTQTLKAAMDVAHAEILGFQVNVQALQVKAMEPRGRCRI